ncbi:MAG: endopeptidase La [candidate division Zixibacteria bacterium]|nr:endopeptidase La [candidate division Zixibacteria bacterium]
MIIKSKYRLPLQTAEKPHTYPVLPLMTGVLFPGMIFTIQIGRAENLRLLEDCVKSARQFVASYSHAEVETPESQPIHQVGVFAEFRDVKDAPGGSKLVTIEGLTRAAILSTTGYEPYLTAEAAEIELSLHASKAVKTKISEVISIVSEITQLDPIYSPELSRVLQLNLEEPSLLADRVAASFHFSLSAKQDLLEACALDVRYERLLHYLNGELSRVATVLNINENVKRRIEEDQRKQYLKQQLQEIKKQLGEDVGDEKELGRIRAMLKTSDNLPPEVINRAKIELDRLNQLPTVSAEYGVTKAYLDWLLNLPWGKRSPESYQIVDVEKVLSTDFYGPDSLKKQILQRLSVRKLLSGVDEGPSLCLVGAPGTGKASLARAIAKALGKEFIRISVGGISDATELKGSPRTFLGANPGRIIRLLRNCATSDPLILIEDIDYFNVDNDSSVNISLLEVVDSRRNGKFLDNYLGVPFDLSKALFICSVRSYEEIPEQFVPRLEVIELPGYIEKEKTIIAKKYILPSLFKRHGLVRSEITMSDKSLSRIITNYTQEAGLLGFSSQIEKICRKIALEKAEHKRTSWTLNEKNLESYLGTPIYIPEKAETLPEIGNAAGLAWTGSGGELMFIEGLKMKGEGHIITTGSLGDVMRESIQAAHSYVRSKADMLGIDSNDFNGFDIHIHFPSGAIPKDGPSAGITVCLVIASVMSERPIRNDIAMTGEVTLRGRVLPVGGAKEKISAAYRAGIYNVVLPKENRKDIKDLPREIIRKTKFHYIDRVDELFELCLLDYTPSSYTLEKLFTQEMEKAKRKKIIVRKPPRVKSVAKRRR